MSSLGKWVASGVFTSLGMQEMKKKKKCRRRKRFQGDLISSGLDMLGSEMTSEGFALVDGTMV